MKHLKILTKRVIAWAAHLASKNYSEFCGAAGVAVVCLSSSSRGAILTFLSFQDNFLKLGQQMVLRAQIPHSSNKDNVLFLVPQDGLCQLSLRMLLYYHRDGDVHLDGYGYVSTSRNLM